MASTILRSDEIIVCPKCENRFPIEQGITKQTIEQHEQEYNRLLEERSAEMREELSKDAAKAAEKVFKSQINNLQEELENANEKIADSERTITKIFLNL